MKMCSSGCLRKWVQVFDLCEETDKVEGGSELEAF